MGNAYCVMRLANDAMFVDEHPNATCNIRHGVGYNALADLARVGGIERFAGIELQLGDAVGLACARVLHHVECRAAQAR